MPSAAALENFAEALRAGFCSTRKDIVNMTIIAWNDMFGQVEDAAYPDKLLEVFIRLRDVVDLELPNFPVAFQGQVSLHIFRRRHSLTLCKGVSASSLLNHAK